MVFDPSYLFIASGTCRMYSSEDDHLEQPEQVHKFGVDLVYLNAHANDWLDKRLSSSRRFSTSSVDDDLPLRDLLNVVGEYCRSNNASDRTSLSLARLARLRHSTPER